MAKPSREYIYGVNPAFEVIRGGKRTLYEAYLNEATVQHPRLRKLHELIERRNIPCQLVGKQRLHELAGNTEHQGVVLKSGTYPYSTLEDLFDLPRLLLLDNVEDPHNVGAIIRSAEIFGFHGVLLPRRGCPEVYPSIVKVSAGATEFLRIVKSDPSNAYVKRAAAEGYRIAALDAAGKASLEELATAAPERLLLVVGGEDRSVGQFILNMADAILGIPQQGRINSLNASVAAGIAMHALRMRQSPG